MWTIWTTTNKLEYARNCLKQNWTYIHYYTIESRLLSWSCWSCLTCFEDFTQPPNPNVWSNYPTYCVRVLLNLLLTAFSSALLVCLSVWFFFAWRGWHLPFWLPLLFSCWILLSPCLTCLVHRVASFQLSTSWTVSLHILGWQHNLSEMALSWWSAHIKQSTHMWPLFLSAPMHCERFF